MIPSFLQTQGAWRAFPPHIYSGHAAVSASREPGGRSSVTSVRDVELEILEVVVSGALLRVAEGVTVAFLMYDQLQYMRAQRFWNRWCGRGG